MSTSASSASSALKSQPSEPEGGDLLVEAYEALGVAIRRIRKTIEEVTADLDIKPNSTKSSHLAFLGEKLSALMRELRLYEKHEQERSLAMSVDEEFKGLREYLRDLPVERRADVRAYLDELEGSGSLLGHDVAPSE